MRHVIVMTKVTATPMPKALEVLLETPRKGHIPKNCTTTKLFTNTAATIIVKNAIT